MVLDGLSCFVDEHFTPAAAIALQWKGDEELGAVELTSS